MASLRSAMSALALEAYRKALREDPQSVGAMMGIATCYDRMGRFDLSRRHYEMALGGQARRYRYLCAIRPFPGYAGEA